MGVFGRLTSNFAVILDSERVGLGVDRVGSLLWIMERHAVGASVIINCSLPIHAGLLAGSVAADGNRSWW